jgi:hypothetical protein
LPFIEVALATDTKANAGDSFAAGWWNYSLAFLAVKQTFALRQAASSQFNSVFYAGVYLILYCPVSGPATGHDLLPVLFILDNHSTDLTLCLRIR